MGEHLFHSSSVRERCRMALNTWQVAVDGGFSGVPNNSACLHFWSMAFQDSGFYQPLCASIVCSSQLYRACFQLHKVEVKADKPLRNRGLCHSHPEGTTDFCLPPSSAASVPFLLSSIGCFCWSSLLCCLHLIPFDYFSLTFSLSSYFFFPVLLHQLLIFFHFVSPFFFFFLSSCSLIFPISSLLLMKWCFPFCPWFTFVTG